MPKTLPVAAAALAAQAAAPAAETARAAGEAPQVYFMLPNATTIRFQRRDAPLSVAAMADRMPSAGVWSWAEACEWAGDAPRCEGR
jgi:D-xylose transport system substrate-binding protein